MRVRASRGVKVAGFHGNYYLRGADLLALPTCDSDKAFVCDLVHEEQNLTTSHVCVQCALLYTTSDGERRIRVHNLNLPVTQNMAELYATMDVPCTINSLIKTAVEQNMAELYATIDVPCTINSLIKTAVEQGLATKRMDARSRIQSA
ncbi:hypothetical protein T484DRAFT_1810588, partial [Baffinella frigidus]